MSLGEASSIFSGRIIDSSCGTGGAAGAGVSTGPAAGVGRCGSGKRNSAGSSHDLQLFVFRVPGRAATSRCP